MYADTGWEVFSHTCSHALNWSNVSEMNCESIFSLNTVSVQVSFTQMIKKKHIFTITPDDV